MLSETFWRYGFFIHLSLVILVVISAYLGIIPAIFTIIPYSDLIGHVLLIGLLAFFLDGLLNFRQLISGKLSFFRSAPMIILIIAMFEELLQSLSSKRTSCLWDFIADVIGIFLFSWFAKQIGKKTSRLPSTY